MNELVLERQVEVSPSLLWAAWSDAEQLKKWWVPRPYQTPQAHIELRPGGRFDTQMRTPEGVDMPHGEGSILEVISYRRIVFTSALRADFVPNLLPPGDDCTSLSFSAIITMQPHDQGTLYKARALHTTEEQRLAHEKMGFMEGWGICLDQLCEVAKGLKGLKLPIKHQVVIDAAKDKIWHTLLSPETYPKWTRVWDKESHFVGGWQVGQKIAFRGSGGCGICGVIESHIPEQEVIIRYTGALENGEEVTGCGWAGARESYRLVECDGLIELQIESEVLAEYAEFMQAAWPKALENVRVLAEVG
jgi:uncharacterized protein YndB with AHSA1/START domain